MALTYDQSQALMNDSAFRGRVKVALLKFADFIMGEANTVPAHNTRLRYANRIFAQPDMEAQQIQPPVVMDNQVQTDGSAITDAALQTSVETVANKLM